MARSKKNFNKDEPKEVNPFRVRPHSIEAEKAVLACLFLNKDLINNALSKLTIDHFYIDTHQFIYEAIKNLVNKSFEVDYVTLIDELNRLDYKSKISDDYLIELADYLPSSSSYESYESILVDKFRLRQLIQANEEQLSEAYRAESDAQTLLNKANSVITNLATANSKNEFQNVKTLLNDGVKRLFALHAKKSSLTGVDTGYKKLNDITNGWQNKDLVILAGRPSMGKTAFALNLAKSAAKQFSTDFKNEINTGNITAKQKHVVLFSLEMGADQLLNRIITMQCKIESNKIRTGHLDASDFEKLSIKMSDIAEMPLFIDDASGLTTQMLLSKCRKLHHDSNIGIIFIDYLQLMDGEGEENRQQEISKISRDLKKIAKELDVPVIALSQLSRALENRTDKRPQLSDLRESGSIEQDADIVAFVHRPEYYKIPKFDDGSTTESIAEIIIGKNRNGPIDEARLYFEKIYGSFLELDNVHVTYATNSEPSPVPGF